MPDLISQRVRPLLTGMCQISPRYQLFKHDIGIWQIPEWYHVTHLARNFVKFLICFCGVQVRGPEVDDGHHPVLEQLVELALVQNLLRIRGSGKAEQFPDMGC